MSRNKKSEVNSEFIGVVVGVAAVLIGKIILDNRSPRKRVVREITKQLIGYRKLGKNVLQMVGHA